MAQSVLEACGVRYADWKTDEDAHRCLDQMNVHYEKNAKRGDCLAALFDEYVEATLIQPTFVTDYPVDISPLAKRKPENPDLTERFEFFISGHEMGNAFSELNDPIDQRRRFEEQVRIRTAEGIHAEVDEDFVTALEYGLPPTGGLGFGIDRMVMLLTNNTSIRDVLLFPTMVPATFIIFLIASPFDGLVYSQMLLSIQLPITIFTLIFLTSSKKVMGKYVNSPLDKMILWLIGLVVTFLNIALLVSSL